LPLLTLNELTIAFGDQKLLDGASLKIESGQRIGLIGRNGEGKSTLLRIIAGLVTADEGEVRLAQGSSVSMLDQSPVGESVRSVFDEVASGLGKTGEIIIKLRQASAAAGEDQDNLELQGELKQKLEAVEGWGLQAQVNKTLQKLGLNPDDNVASLSGGWQRRVALARALVSSPQILLLDEPTNHLDIETISWLEKQLSRFQGAMVIVTHDRTFLENIATSIVELDRGVLSRWPGSYADYLTRKQAFLENESRQNAEFDKKLAGEEKWIRKGIQARRTRNEGRVRALNKMRRERQQRRDSKSGVTFSLDSGNQSGKLVIEASNITFRYGDSPLVENFSARIVRGDRIGLIGPNGSGKSTLLGLLLGEFEPLNGTVRHGTRFEVGYFDQLRSELDLERTVIDTIGQGREEITVNGKHRHVISYLSDFLFTPARSRSPIKSLSGGERARVLLALLFSRPANVLVMDEPTNDLDIETLELLEELLLNYDGTLLLVSHDRKFLDNVVTSTICFEGNGVVREYVGGYSDWLRQSAGSGESSNRNSRPEKMRKATGEFAASGAAAKKKLSYNQKRELDNLPERIELLEAEQAELTTKISDPDFYNQPADNINQVLDKIKSISDELERCYQRWDQLEN
jgi:ATP-binding cassette subfamily F protein uup